MPKPLDSAPGTGQRLAKRVAKIKACSRNEAEQYIEGGWVQVNGKVIEEPQFRVADDLPDWQIVVDAHASLMDVQMVTLLLHKPPGFSAMASSGVLNQRHKLALELLCAASHVANDSSETRLLKRHFAKLMAGVPLEPAASGLVVFTQDWRVARKFEADSGVIEQELIVEVAGQVDPAVLNRLNQGVAGDGQPLPPIKVSLNSTSDMSSKLRFAVKGVHPGLIAHLCDRVGLTIKSVKRLRIGRVVMGPLLVGQWRYLLAHERF